MRYLKIQNCLFISMMLNSCNSDKNKSDNELLERRLNLIELKVDAIMDQMQLERSVKDAQDAGGDVNVIKPKE